MNGFSDVNGTFYNKSRLRFVIGAYVYLFFVWKSKGSLTYLYDNVICRKNIGKTDCVRVTD